MLCSFITYVGKIGGSLGYCLSHWLISFFSRDAQRIVREKQRRIDHANRALRLLRTASIVWPNSASEVLLTGSFDGWSTQVSSYNMINLIKETKLLHIWCSVEFDMSLPFRNCIALS